VKRGSLCEVMIPNECWFLVDLALLATEAPLLAPLAPLFALPTIIFLVQRGIATIVFFIIIYLTFFLKI